MNSLVNISWVYSLGVHGCCKSEAVRFICGCPRTLPGVKMYSVMIHVISMHESSFLIVSQLLFANLYLLTRS